MQKTRRMWGKTRHWFGIGSQANHANQMQWQGWHYFGWGWATWNICQEWMKTFAGSFLKYGTETRLAWRSWYSSQYKQDCCKKKKSATELEVLTSPGVEKQGLEAWGNDNCWKRHEQGPPGVGDGAFAQWYSISLVEDFRFNHWQLQVQEKKKSILRNASISQFWWWIKKN